MKTIFVLTCLGLMLHPGVAFSQVQQAMPFPKAAKIRTSDARVAAEVMDCADWVRKLDLLPKNHKWAESKQAPKVPVKGEFETTDQFNERVSLFAREFEPTWVNVAFKVDPTSLNYNADLKKLSVRYSKATAGLDSSFSEKRNAYTGMNAFGVTASVKKINLRSTAAVFEPPTSVLPVNLNINVGPAEARSIEERGIVHVLGVLKKTNGTGGFSGATLGSPTDFSYGHQNIHMQPICVVATVDGAEVPEWRFFSSPMTLAQLTPPRPRTVSPEIAMQNYPASALRQGLQGRVKVRLAISELGRVTDCAIVDSSSHTVLDEAACQHFRRAAKFDPASQFGQPVPSIFETGLAYSLPN